MSKRAEKTFNFAEFQLDTEEKQLRQGKKNIALPPKVLDVLCLLVEKEGRIVSKNEIMETVWADSFVEESNLTQSIYQLRRTLGTDQDGKNIIETIPRRGFRIAVPIAREREAIGETIQPPISPLAPRPYRPIVTVAIIVIAISLIGYFAYNYFSSSKKIPAPIENVAMQRLTFSGDISTPTISPDGKSIAFVKQNELYLQDINTGSNVKINVVDHKVFGNLQFSLDGETLYFRNERRTNSGGDIFQVSRFGGVAKKILENSWSGIGIAPNGKQISFVRFFPTEAKWVLYRKDLATGEEKVLLERNSPNSIYRTGFPAWSPDGKKIVTVAQEKPASTIYVIDVETSNAEKQPTPRFVQIEQTLWSAKGDSILLVGREKDRFFQLWKLNYPSGELQRITNDLSIYRHISLSADGKSLISENQSFYSHLWAGSAENLQELKQLTSGNLNRDGNAGLAWTPDGNLIYASRISGDIDLWSLRVKDGLKTQLTKNAGLNNENPIVSADGKFIYFESTRTGARHIWRIDIAGSNPMQITFSENENDFFPTLSADGNYLYFLKKSPKGNVILSKNLADNKIETITALGKYSPETFLSISPDGKKLAFHNIKEKGEEENSVKTTEIGVVFLEEQNRVQLYQSPQLGGTFHWTQDGASFEYLENTREGAKIWRRSFAENSEAKEFVNIPNDQLYHFVWSKDFKNLVFARGRQERDVIMLRNFE